MKNNNIFFNIFFIFILFLYPTYVSAQGVQIKDLTQIAGVRENQLIGYGLVVGLAGTGDSRSKLAQKSMAEILGNLGHPFELSGESKRNIAAVIVTANVSTFAQIGQKIDVTVSSLADASSLSGGVLLQTALYGGDNNVYAVAQGRILPKTSLETNRTQNVSRLQNRMTVAPIEKAALIEKRIVFASTSPFASNSKDTKIIQLNLHYMDLHTLNQIHERIQEEFPTLKVRKESINLLLEIPPSLDAITTIAAIGDLYVQPKYNAKIIVNEKTSSIILGGDIKLEKISIAQFKKMGEQLNNFNSNSLSSLAQLNTSKIDDANESQIEYIEEDSIEKLLSALSNLEIEIKDIIEILKTLRSVGALHAELIIRK